MHRLATPLAILTSLCVLWSTPALAYIGPGAGITVLSALWGVVVAIALAIGAVLLWPFRVLLRRRRKRKVEPAEGTTASSEARASEPEHNRELSPKKSS
jgi:hypothetical protein